MYSSYLVALFPLAALAAIDGHCTGTATGIWLQDGICETIATCDYYHGTYMTGGCPNDGNDVKCCLVGLSGGTGGSSVNPCGGDSFCEWTSLPCSGTFVTGHCPGGSNYKCCLS